VHCQLAQRHPTSRQVGSQSQWSGVSGEGEFIGAIDRTHSGGNFPLNPLVSLARIALK